MSDIDGKAKRMYWVSAYKDRQHLQLTLFHYSVEELVELLECTGFTNVLAIPAGPISHRHIENLD